MEKKLLSEIEGFRLFLKSVKRLPMQRSDAPSDHSGLYEKYLPYAVALEVEQAWGDQFLALASTFHQLPGVAQSRFISECGTENPLRLCTDHRRPKDGPSDSP